MDTRLMRAIIWCKNQGFPYKIINNVLYWQTNISTAEFHSDGTIRWHYREDFDKI